MIMTPRRRYLQLLHNYLEQNRDGLIAELPDGTSLEKISNLLEQDLLQKSLEQTGQVENEEKILPKRNQVESCAINFSCTLCQGKMYPVRKYFKIGKKRKILIVTYNGPYGKMKRIDQSDDFFFNDQEEDQLMAEIFCCTHSKQFEDFFFQEVPACHFDGQKSLDQDWQQRTHNCLQFLERNVQDYQIEKMILIGLSALWISGKEQSLKSINSQEVLRLKMKQVEIPYIILNSPTRLLRYYTHDKAQYQRLVAVMKEKVARFCV